MVCRYVVFLSLVGTANAERLSSWTVRLSRPVICSWCGTTAIAGRPVFRNLGKWPFGAPPSANLPSSASFFTAHTGVEKRPLRLLHLL